MLYFYATAAIFALFFLFFSYLIGMGALSIVANCFGGAQAPNVITINSAYYLLNASRLSSCAEQK
jgi:hypothetical protein